ncbi:MAG: isoleucine--tRNA ligase [Solirubrobacterales bacterium]|nr:isoleucine--tRNA ligase [Solirubrobacterales bacterium]MCB8971909.1 isoleucine--tRNA ligase [Thermoleophilales bacterium]
MPAGKRYEPVDPKQSFPALEERILERWRERDVFARQLAEREGAPVWSFYEGPPTANGRPGSHHVLARVFKDIYPRYQAMRGHYVPRKAGWDCHGLPVELEVEKELGISSKEQIEEYGIAEFNQRCRDSVFRYVDDWRRLTERIGFWVDMDDPYRTLDNDYIESVWWSLRQSWDRDRLYQGHKVVPYCPRCGTALSSHEVALGYEDQVDPSTYVRMPVTDPAGSGLESGDNLLVWTTTPWTLISHAAIAAGPEIRYVRARPGGDDPTDEVVVVAKALAERVLGEGWEELASLTGRDLEGIRYEAPFGYIHGEDFGPLGHSVLLGDFVTTEDGTGLVHTALAFGEDDFRLGESYGMTLQNPVLPNGRFDSRVTDFQGELVYDHNPEIVEALRASGRLFRVVDYEHAYPHCWRCGTALLYYAKSSWYLRTSEVKDRLLAENERIGWHPEHIKHGRFGRWLENNVDWALSRERYWGTPLPIWECTAEDCEERFCAGSIADLRERVAAGSEVPEDLHRPYIDEVRLRCPADGCEGEMQRVVETIDAWYDSGAMPFAQFHYPFENETEFESRFPADFICEGIDQTRGWFYSQLAESVLLFDETNYRNCVCLGLILDPEGQKMSKSRGNIVDPWEVLNLHGADAFRWYYLTSQQPWAGYRFSVETIGESLRQFLLTLWNTYGFLVMYENAAEGQEAGPEPDAAEAELDRWLVSRLQAVSAEVGERLDDFDSVGAGKALADYVDEMSNWYVRVSRRRFWEGDVAAFATLRHCLVETAKLIAPFVPFTADAIYVNLVGGADGEFGDAPDSVHLSDFPEPADALRDPELEAGMDAARRAVELGRAARAQAKAKMRQPLAKAVIVATEEERAVIERFADLVEAELNVKALEFVSEEGELASWTVKPNFRSLGPRFGKDVPQAKAAIEALDPDHARAAIAGEREIGIAIDGVDHTLHPEDMTLAMQPLDGYQVEAEAGRAVALALELDDELIREGLAREVVRAVQQARKDAGLEITDRIDLRLGGDEDLLAAARAHEDYVTGETLATSVTYDGSGGEPIEIGGRELSVGVGRTG